MLFIYSWGWIWSNKAFKTENMTFSHGQTSKSTFLHKCRVPTWGPFSCVIFSVFSIFFQVISFKPRQQFQRHFMVRFMAPVCAVQYRIYQHRRDAHKQWCARLLLYVLTFSLHLKMTAGFHFPRRDQTGMAVMALMNARINRRRETRQRRRWMCLKGRILGSSEFCEKTWISFFGMHLCAWKRLAVFVQTTAQFYVLYT